MTQTQGLKSAAHIAYGVIFLGYAVGYALRFSPIANFKLLVGFSFLTLIAGLLMIVASICFGVKVLSRHERVFLLWISFAASYATICVALGFPTHSYIAQMTGLLQTLILWLIFRNVDLHGRSMFWTSILAVIFTSIAVFAVPEEIDQSEAALLSYHTSALVLFISGFILITTVRTIFAVAITLAILGVLNENGARTEFFLFAMIAPLIAMRRYPKIGFFISSLALAGGSLFIIGNIEMLLQIEGISRILGVFNPSEDRSFLIRSIILSYALETIATHTFTGNYASYPPGLYSHNMLSAWVDFGLLGFSLYTIILGFLLLQGLKIFRSNHVFGLPSILLTGALILSTALSKAYFHPLVGIVAGILVALSAMVDRQSASHCRNGQVPSLSPSRPGNAQVPRASAR